MIRLGNISKQFGGQDVLNRVSFRIGDGDRLAVVGPNGAGKSTLLKIILGEIEPDRGVVERSRADTTGYLPQEGVVHSGRTVSDEAATAFQDLLNLHRRAGEIHDEIEKLRPGGAEAAPELENLVTELGRIQHSIEHREGWSLEHKVQEVLAGLGFLPEDLHRSVEEFSGGWQMRLALAKLLLREPTVLMLDEPTNHLDMESLRWVEGYLESYEGAVVVISHDRRFLDNITSRTLELSGGRCTLYSGNYSAYLKEREKRRALLRARYENQQDKIRSTMEFVERFRAKNTKARQVQSRLRMLDKMDLVEMEAEQGDISFSFPAPPKPGKIVMTLEGVAKHYGPTHVFSDVDLVLERGDRLALLGPNGTGKSTLARIIAGLEPFEEGTRTPGHNVSVAYYAQHRAEELDRDQTVLATVEEAAPPGMQGRLRTLLGCFLFQGDDVFKTVGVLSGGEKSRLALAKLLLTPANLLILDEPTNHLDMSSKEVLRNALARFSGSCIIVSHDRDFLEPLINKVADFKEGRMRLFLNTVSEYLQKIDREHAREKQVPAAGQKPATVDDKRRRRDEHRQRKERQRRLERLRRALKEAEDRIAALEARKKELEKELSCDMTCSDRDRVAGLSREYADISEQLDCRYQEWEALQEERDAVRP